jgi:N-acetylmuramoyl-L-alanine amidase
MNPALLYLIKVVICSGVLFGYYCLALRNKTFHQWNRFFLLACVVLSLTAPLLKITLGPAHAPAPQTLLRILNVVPATDEVEVISKAGNSFSLSTKLIAELGYAFVTLVLFCIVIGNSVRIYNILRFHTKTQLHNICFLNTEAKGTPFSFFRFIIWNRNIDLHSENGQRIFQHELTHVQQGHTWDKVFLVLLLIPFWCNPFFWLIRRELTALHEFAADQKAMESHDVSALAKLILNTTFPEQHLLFTNPFFQSTIKRRLTMFTKLQNPKVNYTSRILALPVLLIVIAAFTIKTKAHSNAFSVALDKTITVVIDAGHGALQDGAQQGDISESEIALAIAKKIKAQNTNKNIRVILTRETAETIDLQKRVAIASENKADLFLSIHINAAPQEKERHGMEVIVPSKKPSYQQHSELLGSVLVQELGGLYPTKPDLKQTTIWVIDHNICPAVLIECGYLTNENDLAFIRQDKNQSRLADKILNAIAQYGVLKNTGSVPMRKDTLPQPIHKDNAAIDAQNFPWPWRSEYLFYGDAKKEKDPC